MTRSRYARPPLWTATRSGWQIERAWAFDAGKKVTGRIHHLVVHTLRLTLAGAVPKADARDSVGMRPVLGQLGWEEFRRLETVFAHTAYPNTLEHFATDEKGLRPQIVPGPQGQSTFVALPKRWFVERTFAWLLRCQRPRKHMRDDHHKQRRPDRRRHDPSHGPDN